MTDARRKLEDLHRDERGAVMIMGLFMSCFLIGGLWFLIGIGDAIIFRERMQEATDHAGFASAVLHAKGMNFVTLLNAVLLVLTVVYILMGIVHDILAVLCVATGYACAAYQPWRNIWLNYFKAMKPIARAVHVAEEAVAYGAPWVGLGVGAKLGKSYGEHTPKKPSLKVIPTSLSMMPTRLPGLGKDNKEGGTFSRGASKYGLPLEARPFNVLCDKVGRLPGSLMGMTGQDAGSASGAISSLLASGVKVRYCSAFDINGFVKGNDSSSKDSFTGVGGGSVGGGRRARSRYDSSGIGDVLGGGGGGGNNGNGNNNGGSGDGGGDMDPSMDKFWSEDGPLYVYSGAENGDEYFQVWTFNLFPKFQEQSLRRVGIGAGKTGAATLANSPPQARAYFAQAEFYYDCKKGWKDPDCNGEWQDANASFSMKWTSRMRAFDGQFATNFGDAIGKALTSTIQMGISKALEKMNMPRFLADELGIQVGEKIGEAIGLDENGELTKLVKDKLDFLNLNMTPYH